MVLNKFPVYRFRWLLYELVKRDMKLRYRGSVLGIAWTLLNPVLFMGVYTLVFSIIMKNGIPHYPIFLLSGLIPWIWFSGSVGQSANSILSGGAYIGKTLMPAELLVLNPVISNGVNFCITMVLFIIVCLALGMNTGWALLFLPFLALIQFVVTLGVSLIVAVANVFYRDVQQVVNYVITAGFFLTPIFYTRSSVPDNMKFILDFNPLAGLIASFQDVFYHGVAPDPKNVLTSAAFGIAILVAGIAIYNSLRDSLGEYV